MKIFYLIQAHKNPVQLRRLIDTINTSDSQFVIHIDLKSKLEDFTSLIKSDNIYFIKNRLDCIWGDYSQVLATINLIEELKNFGAKEEDRIVFLSGQDYPIKSSEYIKDFFIKYRDTCFIDIEELGDNHLKKYNAFKFNNSNERMDYIMISYKYIFHILSSALKGKIKLSYLKFLLKNKDEEFSLALKPFRGSNWWSMNYDTVEKIITFYKDKKDKFDKFYSYTLCADEYFFQTMITHLAHQDKKIKILPSQTYANWSRKQKILPVTFNKDDFGELINQPDYKLFARKFDLDYDKEIFNLLNKHINAK